MSSAMFWEKSFNSFAACELDQKEVILLDKIISFIAEYGPDFICKYISILIICVLPILFSALCPSKLSKLFCGLFSILHLIYVLIFFKLAGMFSFYNVFATVVWLTYDAFFMYKLSVAKAAQKANEEAKKRKALSPAVSICLVILLFLAEFSAMAVMYMRFKY